MRSKLKEINPLYVQISLPGSVLDLNLCDEITVCCYNARHQLTVMMSLSFMKNHRESPWFMKSLNQVARAVL